MKNRTSLIAVIILSMFTLECMAQNSFLQFNTGAQVQSTNVEELNGSDAFTFEAKVKLTSYTSWTNLLSKITNSTSRIALQSHNGKLYAIVSNGTNAYRYTPSVVLQLNKWYHVAMVYNGQNSGENKVKLFLNGSELQLNNSNTQLPANTPNNTAIFKAANVKLNGCLDEVRIWNTALSSYRINAWKDNPLNSTHPEYSYLALYWDFEDAESSTVAYGAEETTYNGSISNAIYVTEQAPEPYKPTVSTYLPYYFFNKVSKDIFNHLTHIQYFSLGVDANGNLGRLNNKDVFTPLSSIPQVQRDLDTLKSWRGDLPAKIMVTFGGWVQSKYLDEVAASASARANFAQNVKDFLIENGVDGADIDWEGYDGAVNDLNYGKLLNALKVAFAGTSLELSVAVNAQHYSLADEFTANVDRINLMSYGRFYTGGMQVSLSTLQSWVNGWISAGAPAEIIVAGVPAFARTPSEKPTISYRDIINLYNLSNSTNIISHNGYSYYYNGVDAIKQKTNYVINSQLNGIMIWDQGQDTDISHPKSLLRAISSITNVGSLKSMSTMNAPVRQKITLNVNQEVYPNPFSDKLTLALTANEISNATIRLIDINGNEIRRIVRMLKSEGVNHVDLITTDITKGIYILQVQVKDKITIHKLVKR